MNPLTECVGFDWDAGNCGKNWTTHRVSDSECEEVFFNRPFVVRRDLEHSQGESRFYALGQTDRSRGLFVVFTIRGKLIRVISGRDMTRKERRIYQTHEKTEEKGYSEI
ncbi:MAG: BrnT family toxin [Terriglobia bacterium]|jgi:hypothetical protein